MAKIFWHSLSVKESLAANKTSPVGLSNQEAIARLKRYGENKLTENKKTSPWGLFFSQFTSPLIYVLLFAAAITLLLKLTLDAYVILAVLLINAIIGFVQESRAEQSLEALKKFLAPKARVVRNGETKIIPAYSLVVGDIVELTEGSLIPADLRLITANSLKIDESTLTGESIPTHKQVKAISLDAPLVKRSNIAFTGTSIVSGRGLGVVIATGDKTEFGSLAKATTQTISEETPLNKNLNSLSRQLLIAILSAVFAIAIIGILQQRDPLEMFLTSVAVAVSAIPEGLPAIMTIALAVGVRKMAKQNAIVRKLAAIETLGSITVIASDKTGTLTQNQLVVQKIILPDITVNFSGLGFNPVGELSVKDKPLTKTHRHSLQPLLESITLANDAKLQKDKSWQIIGDPTEGSLIVAATKAGIKVKELQELLPRIDEIPFSSERRLMVTVHDNLLLAAKGSIEAILKHSTSLTINGKQTTLSTRRKQAILEQARDVASEGYRVLAVANGHIKEGVKLNYKNLPKLNFLGIVAMLDAPRPEVVNAIKSARKAGIKVKMITGDVAPTALAIASQIKLTNSSSRAVTAQDIEEMTINQFQSAVKNNQVFAEIPPQLKLRIVEELQKEGEVVAVTGDGANDAPILKKAHVGIAMGQGGADVSREVSDMVLADNNFATIVNAIGEGRSIFTNIQRVIWYLLATNLAEILVVLISLFVNMPLPLLPAQILWINVVTEGTGTIGLAVEPKRPDILKGRPRPLKEPFINKLMASRILIVGLTITGIVFALFFYSLNRTNSLEYARSVAFVSLGILQIINLFNARSFRESVIKSSLTNNPVLIWSALASLLITIATVHTKAFQEIFNTVPVESGDWLLIVAASLLVTIAVELHKLFYKNKS